MEGAAVFATADTMPLTAAAVFSAPWVTQPRPLPQKSAALPIAANTATPAA